MGIEQNPYEEGKRAGVHPIVVIFGAIVGLWLFIWLFVPNPKHKQGTLPESVQGNIPEEPDAAPVMFKVNTTIQEMNAIGVVVPPQATDSQIVGLLK
ncbi:MAG: hypothetical protein AABY90_01935, partial [Nitrospirota bacterium]